MKGILFQPWKIKAIRDNPKVVTVTRRVIKPQPTPHPEAGKNVWLFKGSGLGVDCDPQYARYHVGETVYIKEAHATEKAWDDKPLSYLASASDVPLWYQINDPLVSDFVPRGKWRNPRTMPAWAARYFIKIKAVESQRLQSITEEQAIAEGLAIVIGDGGGPGPGCKWNGNGYQDVKTGNYHTTWRDGLCCCGSGLKPAICAYKVLWDSINKPPYGWQANPWVWW